MRPARLNMTAGGDDAVAHQGGANALSRPGTSRVAAILGCCLAAMISGCSFHRTGDGFVLRSNHWSLEHHRDGPAPSATQAPDRPELLPWRNRLKGYRLGGRIFHTHESAAKAEATATDSVETPAADSISFPPEPIRPDLVVE